MYSKSTYRPRRTRIYGANYDIGESYYKQALNNLDDKTKTIRFADTTSGSPDRSYMQRDGRASTETPFPQLTAHRSKFEDDDVISSFRAGTEEPILKKSSFKKYHEKLDDLSSSIKDDGILSLTAVKPKNSNEFGEKSNFLGRERLQRRKDVSSLLEEASMLNTTKKLNESLVADEYMTKSVSHRTENLSLDKFSSDTTASLRAKASKARLANLESEMLQLSEKQNQREKRNLNLKKLLIESDMNDFH